jgi:hypothetical protein
MQAQHLPTVLGVDEAEWLLDEDRLLHLVIEESRLHVHVVDWPREVLGDAQQESHGLQPRHRRKNLLKVDPLLLIISLRHQTGIVFHHRAIFITLELVDPLEADRSMAFGEIHECPCLIVIDGLHLLDHGHPLALALLYFRE